MFIVLAIPLLQICHVFSRFTNIVERIRVIGKLPLFVGGNIKIKKFFFGLFRTAPVTYGSSQARG